MMRVAHGWHVLGHRSIRHTDFFYAGGYCRFSGGHFTVDMCHLAALKKLLLG